MDLLQTSDVISGSNRDVLRQIDRQAFVELLQNRTDLSRQEVNRVANCLYSRWQAVSAHTGVESLVDYLRSAKPEQLMSEQLGLRLEQF